MHGDACAKRSLAHLAFFSAAGIACPYDDDDDDGGGGLCAGGTDAETESIDMGVPIEPDATIRAEWSTYPGGVGGDADDAGDVDVE